MGIYASFFSSHPSGIRAYIDQHATEWWRLQIDLAGLNADVPPANDPHWAQPGAMRQLEDQLYSALEHFFERSDDLMFGDEETLSVCWRLINGQPGSDTDPALDALAAALTHTQHLMHYAASDMMSGLTFGPLLETADELWSDGPKIWRYPSTEELGFSGDVARLWDRRSERGVLQDTWNGRDFSWYTLTECRILLDALRTLGPLPETAIWQDGGWVEVEDLSRKNTRIPARAIHYTRLMLELAVQREIGVVILSG